MPEQYVKMKRGEKRPLYGQTAAESGTLTISATPAPTCTLYDINNVAVTGLVDVAVSGYDAGAMAAPRVWLDLDTHSPANLSAGYYTLIFKYTAIGSDSLEWICRPGVLLCLQEMFT